MTDRSHLAALVERLAGAEVLVVGDAMLDRYVQGEVERISPEAPIPVLRVRSETAMLGGAGNVIRNVAALGGGATLIAAIGDDTAGAEIAGLLQELPGAKSGLVVVHERATSIKTRYLGGGQQMLRADRETVGPLDAAAMSKIVAAAEKAMKTAKVMVLSDYGKGVLAGDMAAKLIAVAAKAGKPAIVDPKGNDYSRYRGAAILTPNRRELGEATGMPVDGDDAVVAAAQRLIATAGVQSVLATRSQEGMTLVAADGTATHLKAEAREVFDVSGAGDTVVAALATTLAIGAGLTDAAELANVAAGIVVGKIGTAAVHADEVVAALHRQDFSSAEAKIATLAAAMEKTAQWRRKGLKVGFTNGCFDLLHPGHVSLLAQARKACDRLVVGLNSDASVKGLKGDGRPVQNESARAQVLASLATVDMVVVFDEPTPLDLIVALKPALLVKGKDYAKDAVVGAAQVESWGGRVLLADLAPGHSTSATIARMGK